LITKLKKGLVTQALLKTRLDYLLVVAGVEVAGVLVPGFALWLLPSHANTPLETEIPNTTNTAITAFFIVRLLSMSS
jgi:hypothetical protein